MDNILLWDVDGVTKNLTTLDDFSKITSAMVSATSPTTTEINRASSHSKPGWITEGDLIRGISSADGVTTTFVDNNYLGIYLGKCTNNQGNTFYGIQIKNKVADANIETAGGDPPINYNMDFYLGVILDRDNERAYLMYCWDKYNSGSNNYYRVYIVTAMYNGTDLLWETFKNGYQPKITSNGGGATHIAKVTGQLKDLSSNLSDILMVSGGGGGGLLVGDADYTGKEAGGISGSGDNSADQSTGNAFGQGESGTNVSGGGSGLYGGYKGVITSKTPVEPFSKYVLSTYANSGTPSVRNLTPMQYSSDGTSFLNNLSDTGSIFQMPNTYISSLSNINYTPRNVAGYSNVGGYLPSGAKYQFTTTSSAIQFDFYDKNETNVYTCEYSKTDNKSVYIGFFKNDNDIAGLILYQENQSEATVITKGNSTYYDMFMSIANVDGSSTPQLTKGGGAGSGYIGNSLLSNKKMVGYNVPTSSAEGTKTESVNDVSESAVSGKPKSGNGFARIKFLHEIENVLICSVNNGAHSITSDIKPLDAVVEGVTFPSDELYWSGFGSNPYCRSAFYYANGYTGIRFVLLFDSQPTFTKTGTHFNSVSATYDSSKGLWKCRFEETSWIDKWNNVESELDAQFDNFADFRTYVLTPKE